MQNKCPTHDIEWKTIPAGISKKTGKPYNAFRVCSVDGCKERPAELDLSDPLDKAISGGIQAPKTAQETVDERSHRIERQHSQDMAIRTMDLWTKLQINDSADITKDELLESIKKLTDHFMGDLDGD